MTPTLALILGSAAVAALVSSLINAIGNWLAKRAELERQDMELAFRLTQLRHDQMIKLREWRIQSGQSAAFAVWDPFMTAIVYRRAMEEFRKTGHWEKGEGELNKLPDELGGKRGTE